MKQSNNDRTPGIPRSIGRQLNFTTGRMNDLCAARLKPHGLSLPQWVILACLWRDGGLTLGTLSQLVGTRLPATSRIVDRMAEQGWVTRQSDAKDGRVTLVTATRKANALKHLANFHESINDTLFDGFTARERAQSFELLKRMESNASKALDSSA